MYFTMENQYYGESVQKQNGLFAKYLGIPSFPLSHSATEDGIDTNTEISGK